MERKAVIRIQDINPMLFSFVEELNEVKVLYYSFFKIISKLHYVFAVIDFGLFEHFHKARIFKMHMNQTCFVRFLLTIELLRIVIPEV